MRDNYIIENLNNKVSKLYHNIKILEQMKSLLIKNNLTLINKYGDNEYDRDLDVRVRDVDRIKNIIGKIDDSHFGIGKKRRSRKKYVKKSRKKSRNKRR